MTQTKPISYVATHRADRMFDADIAGAGAMLNERVRGKRILAIGAAGSIGSNTVTVLANYVPASLHIIDQNENALADLVRNFRSRPGGMPVEDFRTLPLDYGSEAMHLFMQENEPYDIILNFAAIKHVRSEKDMYSTLQMFDTNLTKQARLIHWMKETGFKGRYFSVSTDKAANPTSMMGATKRCMEHVMFSTAISDGLEATITSARFANVAFSNGSLLQAFEQRLARQEPLSAPEACRRYFVSLEESGQICALASVCAPDRSIVIPKLDPEEHLILLEDVARDFLAHHGYEAAIYNDEEAVLSAVESEKAKGRWPLLLTPLNTSGEKPYEEFIAKGEKLLDIGLPNLQALEYLPTPHGNVADMIAQIDTLFVGGNKPGQITKESLKEIIGQLEPGFLDSHRETGENLDQRL